MSEEKELKKGNGEILEETSAQDGEDVEGYAYCGTLAQKCLNDCIYATPSLTHLH